MNYLFADKSFLLWQAGFLAILCLAGGLSHAQEDDAAAMRKINPRPGPPMAIDEERVAAAGIRKLTSDHLLLYTDVRDRPDIDELTRVFDQAVDQWLENFEIEPDRGNEWRMRAFIIEDRPRFKTAGLMPADLPDFLAGYQRGHEMWVYLQPGNYYTRHLLLHEGTHGFMDWFLDGFGAPWYSEGMAELLGVHRWKDKKLDIHYRLRDRRESEFWGRVKIIREEVAEGITMSLDDVLNIPLGAFREVRYYAWSWAATEFLANHPISSQPFAELVPHVNRTTNQFNQVAKTKLQDQWDTLNRDWELFLDEMEYGIDVRKSRLISASPIEKSQHRFEIRADHGWQMTSFEVKQGDRLRISSDSLFQIAKTEKPWPCQANGVTIQYYRGRPLGTLLAGVLGTPGGSVKDETRGLREPLGGGRDFIIEIENEGLLCLRVNESPARMDDNQGVLEVTVEKLK